MFFNDSSKSFDCLCLNRFWAQGEPTHTYEGVKEDCVEITEKKNNTDEGTWNDKNCDYQNRWICEKMIEF